MDSKSRWGCKGKEVHDRQQQHVRHQHWPRANTGRNMSISRSRVSTAPHCSGAASPQESAAGTVMLLSCWPGAQGFRSQLLHKAARTVNTQHIKSQQPLPRKTNRTDTGHKWKGLSFLCPDDGEVGVNSSEFSDLQNWIMLRGQKGPSSVSEVKPVKSGLYPPVCCNRHLNQSCPPKT